MSLANNAAQKFRWLKRSSILRLVLFLSALFAIGMAVAVLLALAFGREAVFERTDATLSNLSARIALGEDFTPPAFLLVVPLDRLSELPKEFSKKTDDGFVTVRLDDDYRDFEDWRVVVSRGSQDNPVLLALPLDDSEEALDLLGGILWTTAGIVIFLALCIGMFFGLVAQQRLVQINKTLDSLAGGNLSARTGIENASDDIGDIAKQLDFTAGSLERMVAQTRNLSASIAHDLRTPLARLRAHIGKFPDSEARSAALGEAGRLSGIFDTIMRIARIEAGSGVEGFEKTDLGSLVQEVYEIFEPVVEDSGKTLLLEENEAETVLVDRKMLIQAFANLVQNAILYGGQNITLFANRSELGVSDNGQGVDPSKYDEIIKPMTRLDETRASEGTGLGLALVRAVADRHNAGLSLSPESPNGLRVTINLTDL